MTAATPARRARGVLLAGLLAAAAGGLTACGSEATPAAAGTPAATTTAATTAAAAMPVTIRDPWVKAADKGMTAAFGTLVNTSGQDVTVTAAATPVSRMELHEMAMQDGKMVMRPKKGGIVIKAGGTHVLEPGGDHLMLMDVTTPVKAGDEVAFTLTTADGGTMSFTAVAKPFSGAGETYAPGGDMDDGDMGGGMTASPSATP